MFRENVLSGTKPFDPVPADFQKPWRLQQLDCNMGTGLGIGQGMMVIGQVITAGCGNRLQLMVRQTAAEMPTGCRKGIIELILRIIHPVHFENLIDAAYRKTGQKVVIIIDEYEKPIINNFDNHEVMEQELKSYFGESMKNLAEMNGLSEEECYEKLASMYDGYHFCEDSIGVYNPFSLLNTFDANKFRMYWFETGTPTFLVRYLKQGNYNLDNISKNDVAVETLTGANYVSPAPITLMYQAGYLTIKDYNPDFFTYNLDYPNEEVKRGFMHSLSQLFAPALIEGELSVYQFVRDIRNGNTKTFMDRLTAFFAGNSYMIQGDLELYFQNVMSIMLKMMGLYVKTEYQTSNGKIDIVFDTDKYVYIIELKRDESAEVALKQIEEKGYDKPFLASGKQIIKLGINFSSETKTIDGWAEA